MPAQSFLVKKCSRCPALPNPCSIVQQNSWFKKPSKSWERLAKGGTVRPECKTGWHATSWFQSCFLCKSGTCFAPYSLGSDWQARQAASLLPRADSRDNIRNFIQELNELGVPTCRFCLFWFEVTLIWLSVQSHTNAPMFDRQGPGLQGPGLMCLA